MKNEYHIEAHTIDGMRINTPEYVSPLITTYTEEQILDQIGPIHAGPIDSSLDVI
jgi:hypothetical protein